MSDRQVRGVYLEWRWAQLGRGGTHDINVVKFAARLRFCPWICGNGRLGLDAGQHVEENVARK